MHDLVQSGNLLLDSNKNPFTGIAYNTSSKSDKKLQESKYLKGLLHGTHKEWWENGNKKFQGRFKSGDKNGRWVGYFENSKIKSEINYKNGIKDGLETHWHENGSSIQRVHIEKVKK